MYEFSFMSKTKGKKMDEKKILKSGICQFSDFEKHISKGIDALFKKLAELKAEDNKITSVSYDLVVRVK